MAYTGATTGYAAGEQTNTSPVDYALETTYNTAPGGTYQRLRITGESLAVQDGTSTPDEINDLPEDAETVLTSRSVSGSVNGVLSYGTFDDFLAGVLGADWLGPIAFTATSSNTVRPNNNLLIFPNDNGNFVSSLPKSSVFRLQSASKSLDYTGFYSGKEYANSVTIGPDFFKKYNWNDGLLADAVVTIYGITNGNLGKTFTVRKKLTGEWQTFTGNMVNQIQIQLQKGQVPTIQIDFVGSDQSIVTADVSSAVNPATTSPLMDTVGGFMGCSIFGNAPAGCIQSATITLARNNSGQDTGMGHVGACGVQFGSLKASMDIEYFFKDFTEFTAWQAGKKGPVSVSIKGSDGYGYQFSVLNGRIFNPKNPISGKNATIVTTISVTGNPLPGGGTFAISRIVPAT
ncbi:phage tail tube protein [Acetobacter indonesiensis]